SLLARCPSQHADPWRSPCADSHWVLRIFALRLATPDRSYGRRLGGGKRMSTIDVPGARLTYETAGRGPVLVMVPGAAGSAELFKRVGEDLAARHTVVTYDRRGFSRSRVVGLQDYAHRLQTDVDDVRRLIEHVSDEPAIIFGSSSGGVVALDVLAHRPSVVRTLVPFEPAAVRILPDGQRWLDFFSPLYGLYRRSGTESALQKFRERAF